MTPSSVPGAVVALGDSITAGASSTKDAWRGWTDRLADRFAKTKSPLSVVNAGLSGDTLRKSAYCPGEKGPDRLERDVFGQTRVRTVVLAFGVNDLAQSDALRQAPSGACPSTTKALVPAMIALYERVAARVHARGLGVVAATITPFGGYFGATNARDSQRRAINSWIRRTTSCDGVVDFARTLEDPADRSRLAPRYDSCDHLHPNDDGHVAMAQRVALPVLLAIGASRTR